MGSITGSDAAGGEGAQCDGVTDVAWGPLPAAITKDAIVADFSAKGGPSELHGKFSFIDSSINWEDGNAWPKLRPEESEFNGAYSDPNHPKCNRLIVLQGNSTGVVYGKDGAEEGAACDGKTDVSWGPLPASITGDDIVVDFSSKGGPSSLRGVFNTGSSAVDWEDGNSWSKILSPISP